MPSLSMGLRLTSVKSAKLFIENSVANSEIMVYS